TFAYELARDLNGGINKSNLELAQTTVVSALNSGLSSLADTGPMSTAIDNSNVAEIVRASEALGETVRRTRDTLVMFNYPGTGDSVVGALASDLTDSLIDGRGGSRADPRTAAIATIASTLVQLETISNELHVYGADATGAMNASIQQISSSTPSTMVDDLLATSEMLSSIESGMIAAVEVSTDAKVVELQQAVNGLQSGMDYALVRTLLPDDYRTTLQNVLLAVGGGDETVVETVNSAVRGDIDSSNSPPPANTPPVISGTPPSEINANTAFDFTPSASDADPGDALTFSISGRPSWANFDTTTGRLSGIPSDSDGGTFANITITVSDGTDSASIGPFSITVQGVSTGSVSLSWAAPTENEDGSTLTDLDGYRLYWGTTPGTYPNTVTIDNPSVTTYLVENLAPGTYQFVATSFNTAGVESDYSSPATKIVP
ncbi:MAG: fibronectin type III domain-containing protein, partial [Gammaproteobacteria bacterium]|nr:fibronectin type III domain-containing protein [Gammaproteobacteria bacterium]